MLEIEFFPSTRVTGGLNHCTISCLCSFYNHNFVIEGDICWDMSLMFVSFFYSWINSSPGLIFYINITINLISCWKESRYIYIGAGLHLVKFEEYQGFCSVMDLLLFLRYDSLEYWILALSVLLLSLSVKNDFTVIASLPFPNFSRLVSAIFYLSLMAIIELLIECIFPWETQNLVFYLWKFWYFFLWSLIISVLLSYSLSQF